MAKNEPQQAMGLLREAVRLGEDLVQKLPDEIAYRIDLCDALMDLAELSTAPAEQELLIRKGVDIAQALVWEHPSTFGGRQSLAVGKHRLAVILYESRRMGEGLTENQVAVETLESLAKDNPDVAFVYSLLGRSRANLIRALTLSGKLGEAETESRKSVDFARRRVQHQANSSAAHRHLIDRLLRRHRRLARDGKKEEARELLEEALVHSRRVDIPDRLTDRRNAANMYLNLADALYSFRRPNDAAETAQRATELYLRVADHRKLIDAHVLRGQALEAMGNWEQAVSDLERALELDEKHRRALLLLSICQAQLGHRTLAEKAYSQFNSLPLVSGSTDADVNRLHARAEELLSKNDEGDEGNEPGTGRGPPF
jgi:tetratricopeptide (TPR) repeat protein